jgi:hypothetical protein
MPSAPHILDVQSPSVEPSGAPPNDYENIHASPEMFGGLIAEGEQKLGKGIEQAGNAATEAWLDQANKQNQIWASQAHSDFSNKASDIAEKYLTLQGQAAVNARPDVQKQIQDLQQQAIDAAPSLNTKMLLSENLRRTTDFLNSRIITHAAQQTNTWNKVVAQGGQEAAANQGSFAATTGGAPNFAYMDAQLRTVDIESHNRYGEAFDLNDQRQKTAFDTQVAKDNGHAVALWVQAKAGDEKDPNAIEHALQIFERYSDHIDPETRDKLHDFITGKGEDHYAHNEAIRLTSPAQPGAVHEGANFMHPGAQYGTLGPGRELDPSHLTEITLSNGQKATVNKASAPAFTGFLNELVDDGAPIGSVGGYNPRNIAGTGMMSQHAMGNAMDIGSQAGRDIVSSDFRKWVQDNPDKWRTALNRWSIYSGGDWSHPDLGHIEWAGAPTGTWTASGQPLPDATTVTQSIMNDPKYAGRPELQDKVLRFSLSRLNLLRAGNADQAADVANNVQTATERARLGDFSLPFPDDRLGVLGMRAAEKARLDYASARREGEMQNAAALAPQRDLDAAGEALKNSANPDEAVRERDVAAWKAFTTRREQALQGPKADPASYVAHYDPGTMAKLKGVDPKNPASFQAYAEGTLAVQSQMEVPPGQQHILTREGASRIANAVIAAPDPKAALDSLQNQWGKHFPQAFNDLVSLGKIPAAYQGIALLNSDQAGHDDAALLSRWLRDTATDSEKKSGARSVEDILGKDVKNQIDVNVRLGTSDLQNALIDSGHTPIEVDNLVHSVEQLAYAKSYYNHGDVGASVDAINAFTSRKEFLTQGKKVTDTINSLDDLKALYDRHGISKEAAGEIAKQRGWGRPPTPPQATVSAPISLQ